MAKPPGHVLEAVVAEYEYATSKHQKYNSPHEGYAVILEELDELWDEIKADSPMSAREECIQVAATAIRFLVDLYENG